MSISRAAYVICDRCGNPGPVECMEGAKGARAQARQERWTRVSGADLCPGCSGHNHWSGICVPGVCPMAGSADPEPSS